MAHRRERQGEALPPTSHRTIRALALGITGSLGLGLAAGARFIRGGIAVPVNLPAGDWYYYCSIPGHEAAGMVGTIHVVAR